MLDYLRERHLTGTKGYTVAEVEKSVREDMLIQAFRMNQFADLPTRPEVQKYYQDNIVRFFRPAGVMVRLLRIDGVKTDPLTGQRVVRKDARGRAEKLREDLQNFGGNFAEMAKANSDDEETKARGGLILVDKNDPYFNPEGYSTQLAEVLRGMEPGQISPIFEMGTSSYAVVKLEGRREAGPAPLEGELYEEIYRALSNQKARKREDAWFRKALSKSLVVLVVNAVPRALPVEFFFEDDTETPRPPVVGSHPSAPDTAPAAPAPAAAP